MSPECSASSTGPQTIASVPCGRCRSRRVKCDRRKPECARCRKGSYSCPGYSEGRRFRDEGPSLRRRFEKTAEAVTKRTSAVSKASATSPIDAIPSNPVSPPADNVRSSLGSTSESVDLTVSGEAGDSNSIGSVSDSLSCDFIEDDFFDLDIDQYYAQGNNSCGFVSNPDDIALQSNLAAECDPGLQEEVDVGTSSQDEMALEWLLMHHFVDVISPWLDVFSENKYFGHAVPVKASRSILLKNSISAVAAKQIGNSKMRGGQTSSWQHAGFGADDVPFCTLNWLYQAASFYDRAVRCMLHMLQSFGLPVVPPNSHLEALSLQNAEAVVDMLSSVSVILLYESLDSNHLIMKHHLAGFQQLHKFALRYDLSASDFEGVKKGLEACFWTSSLFDLATSYNAEGPTTLGLSEEKTWSQSGLPMAEFEGLWTPTALIPVPESDATSKLSEDLSCRSLVWLLTTACDILHTSSRTPSADQDPLRKIYTWDQIDRCLDVWHSLLPQGFSVCMRFPQTTLQTSSDKSQWSNSSHTSHPEGAFSKVFCANPTGTVALVLYHFLRLVMLLKKPAEPEAERQTGAEKLRSYRDFTRQVDAHVQEICGIIAGGPQQASLIHLLQPLCLAGSCLEQDEQRSALLAVLDKLQQQVGCSNGSRAETLRSEWGWI